MSSRAGRSKREVLGNASTQRWRSRNGRVHSKGKLEVSSQVRVEEP